MLEKVIGQLPVGRRRGRSGAAGIRPQPGGRARAVQTDERDRAGRWQGRVLYVGQPMVMVFARELTPGAVGSSRGRRRPVRRPMPGWGAASCADRRDGGGILAKW